MYKMISRLLTSIDFYHNVLTKQFSLLILQFESNNTGIISIIDDAFIQTDFGVGALDASPVSQ